jgi:hypothetical protein
LNTTSNRILRGREYSLNPFDPFRVIARQEQFVLAASFSPAPNNNGDRLDPTPLKLVPDFLSEDTPGLEKDQTGLIDQVKIDFGPHRQIARSDQ